MTGEQNKALARIWFERVITTAMSTHFWRPIRPRKCIAGPTVTRWIATKPAVLPSDTSQRSRIANRWSCKRSQKLTLWSLAGQATNAHRRPPRSRSHR